MMKRQLAAIAACLALAGCASSIMQTYVGKTVQEAALDYGPPFSVMDMADGQRAFQWKMSQNIFTPTTSTTYGTANVYAPPGAAFGTINSTSTTITTPGQSSSFDCFYTMFGRWDDGRSAWVLTGFQKPRFMCQ